MLRATPPGEDGVTRNRTTRMGDNDDDGKAKVKRAERGYAEEEEEWDEGDDGIPFDEQPEDSEFLQMVYEADQQALQYVTQVNRQSWERGYKAYHQEHFEGSKYRSTDYNNRSRLFVPKTRTAVRKDMAATAASLFGSMDAVNCGPGDEADPMQRGAAAVLKELVNYRTDRKSSKASIPWFHVAMGSRQTSLITGICLSKQYWKLELRRSGEEEFEDDEDGETKLRDVWEPYIDRPESELFPPENFVIDPAADWRNPAQDAAYIILKYPMRIDEIRRRQKDPRNPWLALSESTLISAGEGAQAAAETLRRAREQGIDRFDKTQTTRHFDIIWVWETYIRTAGEDWTFVSIGDKHMLTKPKPVGEVYPEQHGERPLALGYGSLEAFRIFPMSNVESWQMLQQETNDIRNLTLDALKQNIMPVSKVVRGRNVDLDQLKRRGQGTSILVTKPEDVTWEKIPDMSQGAVAMNQKLDIEFDDLSGQQNYGTVADNNALGRTLGGLKLAAGAANAVQEFDVRIWIETWCEVVLAQIVRLEQYYESDPIILGICGSRAKLHTKYGINEISDELLENNVTITVNVGLGAGDPQQRLQKFQSAVQVALPLIMQAPAFQRGEKEIDDEAVMDEVFGAAGYRDGGKRFVKAGKPSPNPKQEPEIDKIKSEAEKNRAMAKKAIMDAICNVAEVGLVQQQQKIDQIMALFDAHQSHVEQLGKATDLGYKHAGQLADRQMAAKGLNPDGSPVQPPGSELPAGGGGEGGGAPAPGVVAGGEAAPPPTGAISPDIMGGEPGAPMLEPEAKPKSEGEGNRGHKTEHPKPRKRKVKITKRNPQGRATDFEIED